MPDNFTSANLGSTFWGIRDSAGYVMGTAGTVANGADSGMGRLKGVTEFNIPTAAPQRVPVLGDGGIISSFLIPAQDSVEGQVVASVYDSTFASTIESLPLFTTDGYDWALAGVNCVTFKSICFLQNSPAQNQTSGSVGNPGYVVRLVPNCTVQQRMESIQQGSPHSYPYDVTPNAFDRFPWGTALVSGTHGSTSATHLKPFWSPNPIAMHSYIGNGSTTTLTLNETPTAATGTAVLMYLNGTKQTYTTHYTVNTSTRVVTFVTAPTAGQKVVIVYQHVASC